MRAQEGKDNGTKSISCLFRACYMSLIQRECISNATISLHIMYTESKSTKHTNTENVCVFNQGSFSSVSNCSITLNPYETHSKVMLPTILHKINSYK